MAVNRLSVTLLLGVCWHLSGCSLLSSTGSSEDRIHAQELPAESVAAKNQGDVAASGEEVALHWSSNARHAGWDMSGLALGMAMDEVSDEMIWRGFVNDRGAIWKRSEDRVVVEFAAGRLSRALESILLSSEESARREAAAHCMAVGSPAFRDTCDLVVAGVHYRVSVASSPDGWKIVRAMEGVDEGRPEGER